MTFAIRGAEPVGLSAGSATGVTGVSAYCAAADL